MLFKYLTGLFCIFLISCGSFSQISSGINEETGIILEEI